MPGKKRFVLALIAVMTMATALMAQDPSNCCVPPDRIHCDVAYANAMNTADANYASCNAYGYVCYGYWAAEAAAASAALFACQLS